MVISAAGALGSACSLGNINPDGCEQDQDCIAAFGLGSVCDDGFCSAAAECTTGHDCRRAFGGGACLEGRCVDFIPPPPEGICPELEPAGLLSHRYAGAESPVIAGGIFRLGNTADPPMSRGAQLAVREINNNGGLNQGQELGMIICDNGGPNDSLTGDEREARLEVLLDYLAGTLGVPYVVGPVTSSDSLVAINHIVSRRYPTVVISPSATSPQLSSAVDRLDPADEFGLFWRTAPSDVYQGRVLAEQVVPQFPTADPMRIHVAILFIDDTYGAGLANEFSQVWSSVGTSKLFPFDPTSGAQIDFNPIATNIAADGPDAVLMVSVDARQTADFINAMAANATLATIPLYLTDGSKDADRLLDNPELSAGAQNIVQNLLVGTAPAAPSGNAFNFFATSLQDQFQIDPRSFSFVANAYDAGYVGAIGVVFASQDGTRYDGRTVAAGMARLSTGPQVPIGKNDWLAAKSGVTSGNKTIDIVGISGPLDFDASLGEAPGPIEIWRPAFVTCPPPVAGDPCCAGAVPCFDSVTVVQPTL